MVDTQEQDEAQLLPTEVEWYCTMLATLKSRVNLRLERTIL